MVQTFWGKYKVFIIGLLQFVITAIAELAIKTPPDWGVIGYSALLAASTYFAQNYRGQWATIVGVFFGAAITVYTSLRAHQPINVIQLVITGLAQFGFISLPPAKLREYEHSVPIVEAKREAAAIKENNEGQTDTATKSVF